MRATVLLLTCVIWSVGCKPATPAPTPASTSAANTVPNADPPPGYSGAVPSGAMQEELHKLAKMVFRDDSAAGGGDDWMVISCFAVTPHYAPRGKIVGPKEPHATLLRASIREADAQEGDFRYIKLSTDDDARAFVRLVCDGSTGK